MVALLPRFLAGSHIGSYLFLQILKAYFDKQKQYHFAKNKFITQMTHSMHGVPWEKLDVTYTTKDIPPGGHLGCSLTLEKYRNRCDDWKMITSYEKEEAMVAALRQRTQGPVRTFLDANKKIPEAMVWEVRKDANGAPVADA